MFISLFRIINKSKMKKVLFLMLVMLTLFFGCKKPEQVPVVTTIAVSNLTATTATSGGNITSEGSSIVITYGVCWSTKSSPTITDSKTIDVLGTGGYVSNLTGLNGVTVYYVRAYATNVVGTGYGSNVTFTTLGQSPTAMVANAGNISTTTATLNGTVNANFLSTDVTFEYGLTTNYGNTATAIQSPLTDNTNTNVSADIINLNGGTIYHYRVKAVNSLGTTYSNDLTLTTLGQVSTVSILPATNITGTSVTLAGLVNANLLPTVVTFEYGTTTSYGSTVTPSQSPITGNINTSVSADITGLTGGTIYHYRISAVNSSGTSYSSDMTFTTLLSGQVPTVSILNATNINTTSATLNGSVNANNSSTIVTFEYGTTVSYGSTITPSQSLVTGNTNTNVSANITGLTGGTVYHYRMIALNSIGTTNSNDMTFTTLGQVPIVPIVTTLAASSLNTTSATLNGSVNANNLSTVVTFEYGTTTS